MAVDFTRGLVPLNTTPLMQVFAMKEQQRMRQEDMARQKKIDELNMTTQTLRNDIAREELRRLRAENPEALRQAVIASADYLTYSEAMSGAIEGGADFEGPEMQEIMRGLENAYQTLNNIPNLGSQQRESLENINKIFTTGNVEGAQEAIVRFAGQAQYGQQLLAEMEGRQKLNDLMNPAAQGGKLGTPRHYIDKETGNLVAFFDTEQGTVDAQRNPVQVPTDVPIVSGVTLAATEQGGLPEDVSATEKRMMRGRLASTMNLMGSISDAANMVGQNPFVGSQTGRLATFVNDVEAEAKSFAANLLNEGNLKGYQIGEGDSAKSVSAEELLDPSHYDEIFGGSSFDTLGVEASQFRSMATAIAFQAASVIADQEGRSVSDRDVQRFINMIGTNHADPRAIIANLGNVARTADRNYRNWHFVTFDEEFSGDIRMPDFARLSGTAEPFAPSGEARSPESIMEGLMGGTLDFSDLTDEEAESVRPLIFK